MPTPNARYNVSLSPRHLPPCAPNSRSSAAAKGGSTQLLVYTRPCHYGSDDTTLDTTLLPSRTLDTNDPSSPTEANTLKPQRSCAPRLVMQDYKKHIVWACLLILTPLPLAAVLISLIYANLEPQNYSPGFPDSLTINSMN
ncbi:hypothetical protein PV08_11678 [Exophiala spinifera]|uniref:Uncharacterized protein n=1 Tax=Exophiala spinifera TaxID=91928 RepID=A0A0D1ZA59_9EURO|nr:uncharacterized protein PV08_11678 [Exophiala spinifera]KIW09902.1 hypothetical protein PV08_11678 [Exophiala spinifera]